MDADPAITSLLRAWSAGDASALERLTSILYTELKQLARRQMAGERKDHTLQATALVNEVFLRLVDTQGLAWKDRAHFFALSAQIMRRILVNHALARGTQKRGGRAVRVSLENALSDVPPSRGQDLVALDEALQLLAGFDARKAQVVDLRFFGGLSVEETASVLGVSAQTVLRDWTLAKSWLAREIIHS